MVPVATTKQVTEHGVSSSTSWETSKIGCNNNYGEQYSTVSPSPIHVVQKTVYQPILPSVPSLLPQPPPAQGKTVSHQDLNTIRTFSLRK
jgi:hypothetical protein